MHFLAVRKLHRWCDGWNFASSGLFILSDDPVYVALGPLIFPLLILGHLGSGEGSLRDEPLELPGRA